MADISTQLNTIDNSKIGAEVKEAIYEALYILDQAGDKKKRSIDIDHAHTFVWGLTAPPIIGIPEEVE